MAHLPRYPEGKLLVSRMASPRTIPSFPASFLPVPEAGRTKNIRTSCSWEFTCKSWWQQDAFAFLEPHAKPTICSQVWKLKTFHRIWFSIKFLSFEYDNFIYIIIFCYFIYKNVIWMIFKIFEISTNKFSLCFYGKSVRIWI